MHSFFRCISAWQRSRDIVRTETVQTIKSIQVICYYSDRFYHLNFSPVLTCLKCKQIYKAGAGVFKTSPAGAGAEAEKPEICAALSSNETKFSDSFQKGRKVRDIKTKSQQPLGD